LIRGGGVKVDDITINDEVLHLDAGAKISAGKKRHGVLISA
jgi:hypothetical protein